MAPTRCRSLLHRRLFFISFLLCIPFFFVLRALFVHTVHLDIASLCHINRKVPSLSQSKSLNSTSSLKFSILTFADGQALNAIGGIYPSFLESRSIYASLHGYSLKTYFHKPDARRHLVWSKIPAIYDILFAESQASGERNAPIDFDEWVWVLDLDTLIFNFNVKLESIVESAIAAKGSADIIIACDHNGMNAGSFLVRKSEWSRAFLKRWWLRDVKDVPMIDKLFEQAALTDLIRTDKSIAMHVQIAPIRVFNAYGYPAEDVYLFQTGDFIVHCPGPTLKKWLPAYAREWERMMQGCKLRELWMDAGLQFETPNLLY